MYYVRLKLKPGSGEWVVFVPEADDILVLVGGDRDELCGREGAREDEPG